MPMPRPSFRFRTVLTAGLLALAFLTGCSRVPPEEAVSRGQQALLDGDYELAIDLLETAAKAYPDNAVVYYNLGMANLLGKHNRAAENAFLKSSTLEKRPEETSALQGLAEARRRRGNFEGASAAYRAAIQKSYRKPDLLAGLAACEMGYGMTGTASGYLNEALAIDPKNPVAVFNDAILHSRRASEYFNQTRAAKQFFVFLGLPAADENPEQRETALRGLSELNKNRSVELQEEIDEMVMRAYSGNTPALRLKLLGEALDLDRSNAELWERFIANLGYAGYPQSRIDEARRNCARRFPDDPRFQVSAP